MAISSIKVPGSRWRAALAALCACVVLLTGCAQAAHFCASGAGSLSQPGFNNADSSAARVPCLLCLSLQAPSLAALTVSVLPVGNSSAAVVPRTQLRRGTIQSFALYVRPPPAA